ncbi:MAG: ribosomal protein S18-alanine N-acetyltransferase [Clostridia bacterium]|nr:ribosomal protein S18-alanine N-acetyltransferase [Clostridia bacterium]
MIRIETMTEKDVLVVFELEKKLIGSANQETIFKTLSNENLNYYLIFEDDQVVGFLEGLIISPESEIYDIAVDEDYQRKGYAKKLMEFFIDLSKQNGVETILLEVNSNNIKAINLYNLFGFVEYGKRKNYYGDADAILMKKSF